MNIPDYQPLKARLQQFGALRPQAWEKILISSKLTYLKQGETFIRRHGSLAIILAGLIKEHDPTERRTPSIINFLDDLQALSTGRYNQPNFLKACQPTLLIYWDWEALQPLYRNYPELKTIYEGILEQYEQRIALRMRLLELPVTERLDTFRSIFRKLLPYLKKKDIANYLHLNYSHFIRIWNS